MTHKFSPILKNKSLTTYSPTLFNLIAIVVFIAFAIYPTIKTILSLQQTVTEQHKLLERLKDKSRALSEGTNNYNSLPERTRIKLATLLPDSTSVTCFINDVTALATSNGVNISGLQIQPTALTGITKCNLSGQDLERYRQSGLSTNLKEIGFTVNAQGTFAQLSAFLASLNNSPRLIDIESATFSKTTSTSLVLILNGKTYYYH